MRKCACCHRREATWACQPYGPDEGISFSRLGSHYRGFVVVPCCDECKHLIQAGEKVTATVKDDVVTIVDEQARAAADAVAQLNNHAYCQQCRARRPIAMWGGEQLCTCCLANVDEPAFPAAEGVAGTHQACIREQDARVPKAIQDVLSKPDSQKGQR